MIQLGSPPLTPSSTTPSPADATSLPLLRCRFPSQFFCGNANDLALSNNHDRRIGLNGYLPRHGQPYSLQLDLPPLTGLLLVKAS
jgi:hypothetical protein